MENAIIRKLRDHLSGPMDTECGVVYLLCEIRKLLETYPPDEATFALPLYCHWALHVDLSVPKTTLRFLQRVDSYLFDKLYNGETPETLAAENAIFREFVYLETFRGQLGKFLKARGLPSALCEKDADWFTFLKAYAGVIEDGSLSCAWRRSEELKVVRKVTFSKGRDNPDGHVPFSLNWDVLLRDGRRVEINVGTWSNGKLLMWSVHLAS